MAVCDDDLPIEVRNGGPGVRVELTWGDGSTTRARLGPPTPNLAAEAAEAGFPWPTTRRIVVAPGDPPVALLHER